MSFHALDVAVEINRTVAPVVAIIGRFDRGLAKQIREAAQSIVLNLAEGRRRVGKDRLHFFRTAAGSNDEVRKALLLAEAWASVTAASIADALELLDREQAMLWRLTHPR